MSDTITATELAQRLGTDREPVVIDVRESDEVAEWAIPGVMNVPLGQLADRVDELPDGEPVVVVCATGGRSATAAAWLRSQGREAWDLAGGMAAWGEVYDTATLAASGASIVQVRRRGKGCLSYVIGAGGEAFVVDPTADVDRYLEVAAARGWRITKVFDTHLHADHLSGARELAAATGASLHLNPNDAFGFDFEPLVDGARYVLGGEVEVSVEGVHTPGHTAGSTTFRLGDAAVLTGDTLFIDGVGRPDLADRAVEFATSLYHSLHDRVLVLPEDIVVLPGHYGDGVTVRPNQPVAARLSDVRHQVDALGLTEDDFVAWATARAVPRPPNYVEIVNANMGRARLDRDTLRRLELGPNRCASAA